MADTAKQLGTFQDPFNFESLSSGDKVDLPKEYSDIDSLWGKVGSSLGFVDRAAYDEWLRQRDRDYERASINSARAWEEYLESTKYQRTVEDLKKAGLNPWLALQNGVSASASGSSTSTGGSKSSAKSQGDSKSVILGLMAIAKIIAMLA